MAEGTIKLPPGFVLDDGTQGYKGNVTLKNRPIVTNNDGSFSTESSFSVNIQGKEVLLPSIINGKRVSQEDFFRNTVFI